jgi:hypothetical protein
VPVPATETKRGLTIANVTGALPGVAQVADFAHVNETFGAGGADGADVAHPMNTPDAMNKVGCANFRIDSCI